MKRKIKNICIFLFTTVYTTLLFSIPAFATTVTSSFSDATYVDNGKTLTITSHSSTGTTTALQKAFSAFILQWRILIAGITGVATITMILIFIINIIHLGSLPANPMARREIMMRLVTLAICTALLGGITSILTIFYATIFL